MMMMMMMMMIAVLLIITINISLTKYRLGGVVEWLIASANIPHSKCHGTEKQKRSVELSHIFLWHSLSWCTCMKWSTATLWCWSDSYEENLRKACPMILNVVCNLLRRTSWYPRYQKAADKSNSQCVWAEGPCRLAHLCVCVCVLWCVCVCCHTLFSGSLQGA